MATRDFNDFLTEAKKDCADPKGKGYDFTKKEKDADLGEDSAATEAGDCKDGDNVDCETKPKESDDELGEGRVPAALAARLKGKPGFKPHR